MTSKGKYDPPLETLGDQAHALARNRSLPLLLITRRRGWGCAWSRLAHGRAFRQCSPMGRYEAIIAQPLEKV